MDQQLVVFKSAHEHYGINIAAVEGIIKMQEITRLPKLPNFIEGVINLRGAIIPVVDLRKRFDMPNQAATGDSRIITINSEGNKIGIVVDSVSEVLSCTSQYLI